MSKLTIPLVSVALAAFALAGCASTNAWRAMRIDGSSQARFEESVALMRQELPYTRSMLFAMALQDIWVTGASGADAAEAYTAREYFGQLDGLDYSQIISLADTTGPSTVQRYTYSRRQRVVNDARSSLAPPQAAGFTEGPRYYPAASNPWLEIQADFEARHGPYGN